MCTKGWFLSNIDHKFIYICLSQHFSAGINQPPRRFGTWRCCMVIAQVRLKLPTIKGHFKFTVFTQHRCRCFGGACSWHATAGVPPKAAACDRNVQFSTNRPHITHVIQRPTTSTASIFTSKVVWDRPPVQLLQWLMSVPKEFLPELSEMVRNGQYLSGTLVYMLLVPVRVSTWLQFVAYIHGVRLFGEEFPPWMDPGFPCKGQMAVSMYATVWVSGVLM